VCESGVAGGGTVAIQRRAFLRSLLINTISSTRLHISEEHCLSRQNIDSSKEEQKKQKTKSFAF
jgi:hypothetical protein